MKLFKQAQKYGAKARSAASVATLALLSAPVFAQEADGPFTTLMAAIGLEDISVEVVAMGVIIVGIAVAFKAITVAKRAVSKI